MDLDEPMGAAPTQRTPAEPLERNRARQLLRAGDERGIDANDPIGDLIRVVKALLPITTMVLSVGRAAPRWQA